MEVSVPAEGKKDKI